MSIFDVPLILISGALSSLSVYLYLEALKSDSVLSVAPALQMIPVLGYLMDTFVFEEVFSVFSLMGCAAVIVGSLLLTLKIEKVDKIDKFNFKIFALTTFSSAVLVASGTLFKFYAQNYGYWTVQLYEYVGIVFVALLLFIFSFSVRKKLYDIVNRDKVFKTFLLLYIFTEVLMVFSDLTLNYASLLAPLSKVYSINSLQPLFLIILSAIILFFAPKYDTDLKKKIKDKKTIISLTLIILGAVILSVSRY